MAQARKLHDHYFKQAKAEGYLARSAYKLKEIIQKRQLLKRGDRVLDLGCAPGSWLQVASETIGERGVVVGLDLQAVDADLGTNIKTLQGDIFKTEPAQLLALSGKPALFDVVMSDMAPNTTGDGDHFRSVELCRRVLAILPGLLKAGGNMTMKVFEGEEYPNLLKETRLRFNEVKGFKPDATRDVSKEMYIIGIGYKPPLKRTEAAKPAPADGQPGGGGAA